MKIIVASSLKGLAEAVAKKGYNVVASVRSTDELQRLFGSTEAVGDLLLVTEKMEIRGSLIYILQDIHSHFPEVRIIFLATGDLTNTFTVNQLNTLANNGIYDLFYGGKIDINKIQELIENPKAKIDCSEIFNAYRRMSNDTAATPVLKDVNGVEDETVKDNVIAVTSVKPGTGKSFVAANLAVTLARYGKAQGGGAPRILLLEGDLQTLSITTLFGMKDEEHNLKTALAKIDRFFQNNSVDQWYNDAVEEKSFIRRCCLRTDVENLYVLEGHNFDFNDISECDGASYYYLTQYLASEFDEVVIDCNSSLQHPTTDPILQLSKKLYFVYTTDFNNIKLNVRFKDELMKLGLSDKIRYVLNKELVGQQKENFSFEYSDEEIIGDKLRIDFTIPNVDMAVIFNSTYRHAMITTDTSEKTLAIRVKFLQLANDVMQMGNVDDIVSQVENMRKKYRKEANIKSKKDKSSPKKEKKENKDKGFKLFGKK